MRLKGAKSTNIKLNFWLGVLFSSCLLLQIGFVACGQMSSLENISSSQKLGNNGGGYTGLAPQFDSYYDPDRLATDLPTSSLYAWPRYVSWRAGGGCTGAASYAEYEDIKSDVAGLLRYEAVSGRGYLSPSACDAETGSSVPVLSFIFDPTVLVYSGKIYQIQTSTPTKADIKRAVVFCYEEAEGQPKTTTGTNILITENQGSVFAELRLGGLVGSSFQRRHVGPFNVSELGGGTEFNTDDFNLHLQDLASVTTGTVGYFMEGQRINLQVKCIRQ